MPRNLWEIKSGNPVGKNILWGGSSRPTKKSCPRTIKDQLRVKWWKGNYHGTCFCCGRRISYEHIECGRIKAGGEYSVENTRLICKTCNRGMGKQNLKIYMRRNYPERYKKYVPKTEKLTKKSRTKRSPRRTANNLAIKLLEPWN